MCPYCGANRFVSEATLRRSSGQPEDSSLPDSKIVGQTWINLCKSCGQYSLHRDSDHAQLELVDPHDPLSEVA